MSGKKTRLIDANAFRKEIDTYPPFDKKTQDSNAMANLAKESLLVALNNMPTIDAEPVRHGKNVGTDYDETDQFVCSECGIELQGWYRVERDEDDGEETYHEYRLRYCPQCGARLDAE